MSLTSRRSDITLSSYYLPHHPIFKNDTLRVVYDASSKDSNNISLNDTLFTGPKLQQDISALLLNFRLGVVVMTADIRSMFSQILVTPEHRNYLKIFWRFSPDEPLLEYTLNRVPFGLNCSPFLAMRTLIHLANQERERFPLASKALLNCTYVDDICMSCYDLTEARTLQTQLISLLQTAGFELRKWTSNHTELISCLPPDHVNQNSLMFIDNPNSGVKISRLEWSLINDCFSYLVHSINEICTKRNILFDLAHIYDPFGYLCPVSLTAKLLIQSLWVLKEGWDEILPEPIERKWNKFKAQLPNLSCIQIPRYLYTNPLQKIDLCGFCDGSQGLCSLHSRVLIPNKFVKISLVNAKSKVTPLKQLSIPRIELCAALLLSKCMEFVGKTYGEKISIGNIYTFSDNTVVLHWLNSSANKWKPFVGNRVSVIKDRLSIATWYYVQSKNNISDCAS
nr:uncharacterized protein LOC111506656 [Leptinotarsa decemlineata]